MPAQHYMQAKWNITTGCTILSEACKICLIGPYSTHYATYDKLFKNKLAPTLHEQNLQLPGSWNQPRIIEVSPYSDLFNPAFPSDFIRKVFSVITDTPRHIYMLTTKYPHRANNASDILGWPTNLWCGTSIEMNKYMDRLEELALIPAPVKYVEFQPLLENITPFKLDTPIDFVTTQRDLTDNKPFDIQWIENIRTACNTKGIPLIFKTSNNEFPTLTDTAVDVLNFSIDSDKSPALWTIDWPPESDSSNSSEK